MDCRQAILDQCWVIVILILRNKLQWNFNQNTELFIHQYASENTVREMAAILSRGRCVSSNGIVTSFQVDISWLGHTTFLYHCKLWFHPCVYASKHTSHNGNCDGRKQSHNALATQSTRYTACRCCPVDANTPPEHEVTRNPWRRWKSVGGRTSEYFAAPITTGTIPPKDNVLSTFSV